MYIKLNRDLFNNGGSADVEIETASFEGSVDCGLVQCTRRRICISLFNFYDYSQ